MHHWPFFQNVLIYQHIHVQLINRPSQHSSSGVRYEEMMRSTVSSLCPLSPFYTCSLRLLTPTAFWTVCAGDKRGKTPDLSSCSSLWHNYEAKSIALAMSLKDRKASSSGGPWHVKKSLLARMNLTLSQGGQCRRNERKAFQVEAQQGVLGAPGSTAGSV